MSPLEFTARLAALVSRPQLRSISFPGVVAPNAKLRARVVPQGPEPTAQQAKSAAYETNCAHHRTVHLSRAKWSRLEKVLAHLGLEAKAILGRRPAARLCKWPYGSRR